MITGTVNAYHEALIRVLVRDSHGQEHDIEAVVDTGFNGALTLPPQAIADLGLPFRNRSRVTLANGAQEERDVYAAVAIWDGAPRGILVEAAETEPLIGMALL